ncbi:response regulator transcription factor [Pseudomonas sp. NBRC 111129]|uniref:response regulator transcription factor n=1 Tax=Pseudomonas sp. NBRC 111129 TaxID=1661044 RepID=UPI0006D3EF40|nr:helix-turn-helix domain-containing protein [Pseudomonas sp. NBRC 111129]
MNGIIYFGNLQGSTGLLAEKELKTALAICSGMSGKEVARALGCAPGTVKKSVERVFYKLGVSNRAGMVAEAFRRGVISSTATALALIMAIHGMIGDDQAMRIRRGGNSGERKIEIRVATRRAECAMAVA